MNMQTASAKRTHRGTRLQRVLTSAGALALTLVVWGASPANAAVLVGTGGTRGPVLSYGGTICNPFISSGFARNLVDVGAPWVSDTPAYVPPNTSVIGGYQRILWQPWLEKFVNGAWVTVWIGSWMERNSQSGHFGTVFVDVRYLSRYPGPGNFRSGATVQWVADSSHAGGWIQYRHGYGDYFKDAWANFYVAKSTPVNTAYCYAG